MFIRENSKKFNNLEVGTFDKLLTTLRIFFLRTKRDRKKNLNNFLLSIRLLNNFLRKSTKLSKRNGFSPLLDIIEVLGTMKGFAGVLLKSRFLFMYLYVLDHTNQFDL